MVKQQNKQKKKNIRIVVSLDAKQFAIWKSLTKDSSRRYSDAFKLLLDFIIESEKGLLMLKAGGYDENVEKNANTNVEG